MTRENISPRALKKNDGCLLQATTYLACQCARRRNVSSTCRPHQRRGAHFEVAAATPRDWSPTPDQWQESPAVRRQRRGAFFAARSGTRPALQHFHVHRRHRLRVHVSAQVSRPIVEQEERKRQKRQHALIRGHVSRRQRRREPESVSSERSFCRHVLERKHADAGLSSKEQSPFI